MRSYRCDACHKIFLLTDDNYEDDEILRGPAGELLIYKSRGIAHSADLCSDCLALVMKTIESIPAEDD